MKRLIVLVFVLFLSFLIFPASSKQAVYLNKKINLRFKYPESWNKIPLEHYIDKISKQENRELTEQEINNVKKFLPLIGILKYKEPVDFFNPSITVNLFPYGSEKGEKDLKDMTSVFLNHVKNLVKDFKIIEQKKEKKLGNANTIYSKYYFSVVINEVKYLLCTEIWFIHIGEIDSDGAYYLQIEACTLQNEETGSRKEIYNILDSIKIK